MALPIVLTNATMKGSAMAKPAKKLRDKARLRAREREAPAKAAAKDERNRQRLRAMVTHVLGVDPQELGLGIFAKDSPRGPLR